MRNRIVSALRRAFHLLPEVLLVLFVLSLLPLGVLGVAEIKRQVAMLWGSPNTYWETVVHSPWPGVATAACIVGLAAFLFVLWRCWGALWAVARKMIIEALHRKSVAVLLVFFAVLTFTLPFVVKTEGSVKSRVQLVMSYSLVLALVLLSILAIFASAASICGEVEHKQVHITDSKPLRRWQFLLGKWFGVVVMCMGILFAMSGGVYLLILLLAQPPNVERLLARDQTRALVEYNSLLEEVLVARRTFYPHEPPGVDEAAEKAYQETAKAGNLPVTGMGRRRLRREIRGNVLGMMMTIEPGGRFVWQFEGLKPMQEGKLFVRFKAYASTVPGKLMGRWLVLNRQLVQDESGKSEYRYRLVGQVLPPQGGWSVVGFQNFEIPAGAVAPDGTLFLAYENADQSGNVTFPGDQLLNIMQREGAFLPNYYRTVVIMFCHVALLAAIGLAAGSVFSFPVASLIASFFVIVGLVGPWFASIMTPIPSAEKPPYWVELRREVWYAFARVILGIMPHFGKYNPLGNLSDGRTVPWAAVAYAGSVMLLVKGLGALLVGMYVYARRELARVIV
jgi:hypothetical protein